MSRADEIQEAFRNTYLYVDVSMMFPDLKPDLASLQNLLEDLPRTETMFWCCRSSMILAGLGDETPFDRQRALVAALLPQKDIDLLNRMQQEQNKQFMPFNRGQMLELFRWASLFCAPKRTNFAHFESSEARRLFAAAAFISGQLFMRRIGEQQLIAADTERVFPSETLSFTIGTVYATGGATQPKRVLGRGIELLGSYYRNHDPELDQRLQSVAGLNLEQYLLCLASLVPTFLWMERGKTFIDLSRIGQEQPDFHRVFGMFADHESQTDAEVAAALWGETQPRHCDSNKMWSTRPLRDRPILRESWERATIIDPRFWEEKSAVGPLFLSMQGGSDSLARHILGAFGKAYEDYACDILEKMLDVEEGERHSRLIRKVEGTDAREGAFEIDAVYQYQRQLLAVEVKAAFLREDRMDDPERFIVHFDEKYVEREQSDSGTARAVEQLARIARVVAAGNRLAGILEDCEVQLVHPILIAYDSVLGAPKVGEYLAERFRDLLQPDEELPSGQLCKGSVRVAPLVVLTADDIENLESSIVHFKFIQLLLEYEKQCEARFLSLHDYIAVSRYKDMLEANTRLAENAKRVLEDVALKVFGRDISEESADP